MTEVGVLFRGPLVRALLRPIDPKTQTRRLITPRVVGRGPDPAKGPIRTELAPDGTACMIQGDVGYPLPRCRYGRPGDRLWVRETWRTGVAPDHMSPAAIADQCISAGYAKPWAPLKYEADGATRDEHYLRQTSGGVADFGGDWGKTRVAIHLPRWAARIELDVSAVRAEPLQAITEADALAEGVERVDGRPGWFRFGDRTSFVVAPSAVAAFAGGWDLINSDSAPWASNPWVWAISFRRVP